MDTPIRRSVSCVLLFLAGALQCLAAPAQAVQPAPLVLEAQVDGTWVEVLGVDQKRLLGTGPAGNCRVPEDAPLRLTVVSSTHEAFSATAAAAIRQWRLKPGILDGKAVACRMQQAFPFRLK